MRVFISYKRSGLDEEFATAIEKKLEESGHDAFRDVADIEPGEQWTKRLMDEIGRCDVFISLLSNRALESRWVRNEIDFAIEHGKRIVPLILERLTSAYEFQYFRPRFADFHVIYAGGDIEQDVDQLVAKLDTHSNVRPKPITPPDPDISNPAYHRSFLGVTSILIALTLFLVGIISCWLAYAFDSVAWRTLYSHPANAPRFVSGLMVDTLRLLVIILPGMYVLGEYFGFEMKRLLGVWRRSSWRFDTPIRRRRNSQLLLFRLAYIAFALTLAVTTAVPQVEINRRSKAIVDQALRVLPDDIESSQSSYLALLKAAHGAVLRFVPYTLVIYAGMIPLTVIVPLYAIVACDTRNLTRWLTRLATQLAQGATRVDTYREFARLTNRLQATAMRYLYISAAIGLIVHFECWLGQWTGFFPLARIWIAAVSVCGFAALVVSSFAFVYKVYHGRTWQHLDYLGANTNEFAKSSQRMAFIKSMVLSSSSIILLTVPLSVFVRTVWLTRN